MNRSLIVIDLITSKLKSNYHNGSYKNGYNDIAKILSQHGFNRIQGTVYLSEPGFRQAHGTIAIQNLTASLPWFSKSLKGIEFFEISDDFNAQFIVDSVARAKENFEQKMLQFRQELIKLGVPEESIPELLSRYSFDPNKVVTPKNILPIDINFSTNDEF